MATTEGHTHQDPAASNVKSLCIFGGYMATALLLTWQSISVIRRQDSARVRLEKQQLQLQQQEDQNQQQDLANGSTSSNGNKNTTPITPTILTPTQLRRRVWVFGGLAAASLSLTWYYMFAFFAHSYRDWAAAHGVVTASDGLSSLLSDLQLGPWLRDTSLFSLAWGSAMETDARTWWTQQIFGFCSVWTLILATEGSLRRIRGLWVFVLLGQIVAISFASNLSFLAILLSSQHKPEPLKGRARYQVRNPLLVVDSTTLAAYAIVGATFAAVSMTPDLGGGGGGGEQQQQQQQQQQHHQGRGDSWFLPTLLAPHVLAFAPVLLLRPKSPRQLVNPSLVALVMAVLLQTRTTGSVLERGGGMAEILAAFYEHPAVSSVGWDVVLCWVSFVTWSLLRD